MSVDQRTLIDFHLETIKKKVRQSKLEADAAKERAEAAKRHIDDERNKINLSLTEIIDQWQTTDGSVDSHLRMLSAENEDLRRQLEKVTRDCALKDKEIAELQNKLRNGPRHLLP